MKAYSKFSTLATPQKEQAREDQVKNNAGGFVFALDKWAQLDRFLILGSEGGCDSLLPHIVGIKVLSA